MQIKFPIPRYLLNFEPRKLKHQFCDVLIIGSGIAGLSATFNAIKSKKEVIVAIKSKLIDSNTYYAQGGIAGALSKDDSVSLHIADTLKAGGGLCSKKVVHKIIKKGSNAIKKLVDMQFPFDKNENGIDYALEGGHSKARVLHSKGDETGRNLVEFFIKQIEDSKYVKIFEETFLIDLITEKNICIGGLFFSHNRGYFFIFSRRTILCTGGAGRIFRETTNPYIATGDGLSCALRSGAILRDMEFFQFHPTTLYIAGATRALISETVRGEGAHIIDKFGRRFLFDYHPKGELAPRDAVSRAIIKHIKLINDTQVYLDLTHMDSAKVLNRFPAFMKTCTEFGIDIKKDFVPIRPSAHYIIGGVKVDSISRTSIKNLYCCGECSSTTLHGANRLGSNSLLEGLVQSEDAIFSPHYFDIEKLVSSHLKKSYFTERKKISVDIQDMINSLKSLMFMSAGVERNRDLLVQAIDKIDYWSSYILQIEFQNTAGWELQNMLIVSRLITTAALLRTETRGVHYRTDYPEQDDKNWKKHIEFSIKNENLVVNIL